MRQTGESYRRVEKTGEPAYQSIHKEERRTEGRSPRGFVMAKPPMIHRVQRRPEETDRSVQIPREPKGREGRHFSPARQVRRGGSSADLEGQGATGWRSTTKGGPPKGS
ncbi:unnamed protein product [Linum trigynum]|uniref:Uncharacterized protein n=1 Tax=Linum trigynum TaxID=586398 RepID=A0AAV2ER62_9ROSI